VRPLQARLAAFTRPAVRPLSFPFPPHHPQFSAPEQAGAQPVPVPVYETSTGCVAASAQLERSALLEGHVHAIAFSSTAEVGVAWIVFRTSCVVGLHVGMVRGGAGGGHRALPANPLLPAGLPCYTQGDLGVQVSPWPVI